MKKEKCLLCFDVSTSELLGDGWYKNVCGCSTYLVHENVWNRDFEKHIKDDKAFLREQRIRWNAICSFLIEKRKYTDSNNNESSFWFAFFTEGKQLAPFEIEMKKLLAEYPKTIEEKLHLIKHNLYLVYGKSEFTFNNVSWSVLLLEDADVESEKDFWFQTLIDSKCFVSKSFGNMQINLRGIQEAERYKHYMQKSVLPETKEVINEDKTIINNLDQSTTINITGSKIRKSIVGPSNATTNTPIKKKWWQKLFDASWKIICWALGAVGTTLIGLWIGGIFG